ncbi:elongation factor P [Candidatus Peregrinibacteria bacterium]|nr:elongation factor P [Candidatus Peregrinibacteria bacterium]
MGNLTDIRTGVVVKINGSPYLVVWNQFNRKQQRKPVMRTKLKNLINGSTLDKTFLAGESFEFADVSNKRCQYLYKDSDNAVFMDNESYEQFHLPLDQVEGSLPYLKDDTEVYMTFYEGNPISVQPPPKVELKVVETPPGVKGDTATGGTKPATMETGVIVSVPLFINEGDVLLINTETGEYVSRAS